ncbi:hypothetical protein L1987_00546 [Smallanthus sonchifolius]|uniref:Uncharacterized protein n=1 Tax=Smallanthus sonchifolius TaxID=185202 RepID=A0ACB9K2I6_9ASTR|nr:hypothetical protein L1987_00546 [Smallanthus sonchifolius]
MPCIVRESQVLVWALLECRLEVVHHESKQGGEEEDKDIVVRPVNRDETELDSTTSESHFATFNGRDVYALCNDNRWNENRIDAFRDMGKDHHHFWKVVKERAPRTCSRSPTRSKLVIR